MAAVAFVMVVTVEVRSVHVGGRDLSSGVELPVSLKDEGHDPPGDINQRVLVPGSPLLRSGPLLSCSPWRNEVSWNIDLPSEDLHLLVVKLLDKVWRVSESERDRER